MRFQNDFKIIPTRDKITNELQSMLYKLFQQLSSALSRLKIEDNFDGEILSIPDTGTANTEFSVAHHLRRVPKYFIVINIDKAGVIYKGTTTWTTTNVYFKCSASNASVEIFIW